MIKSLKILFLLSSCSCAYAAENVAIYNAHVVSANSLNKAASIAYNLKNVSEQKDKDNLIRILTNLSLTLASLNKELANKQPDITNLERKTDEITKLSKLGSAILKIAINSASAEQKSVQDETINDDSEEEPVSPNSTAGKGLQKILQGIASKLSLPSTEDLDQPKSITKNGCGLQQILQNLVSNMTVPTIEKTSQQVSKNEENDEEVLSNSGIGLQQILKSIVSIDFDLPSSPSPTPSSSTTVTKAVTSPGIRGIFEVLAQNMKNKENGQKTTRPGSGLRRILQSIISKEKRTQQTSRNNGSGLSTVLKALANKFI